MKVSELEGVLLDCWVAKATGRTDVALDTEVGPVIANDSIEDPSGEWFEPSTNWSQGGPIIKREEITIHHCDSWNGKWCAGIVIWLPDHDDWHHGPTPLIAAMRAYVASKFGDEVADDAKKLDTRQTQQ